MENNCPICLESFEKKIRASPDTCEHIFCLPCLEKWSKLGSYCPVDRKRYKKILNLDSDDVIQVKPRKRKKVRPVYDFSVKCEVCLSDESSEILLLCDCCDLGYHLYCLSPPLKKVPAGLWFCPTCIAVEKRLRRGNDKSKIDKAVRNSEGPNFNTKQKRKYETSHDIEADENTDEEISVNEKCKTKNGLKETEAGCKDGSLVTCQNIISEFDNISIKRNCSKDVFNSNTSVDGCNKLELDGHNASSSNGFIKCSKAYNLRYRKRGDQVCSIFKRKLRNYSSDGMCLKNSTSRGVNLLEHYSSESNCSGYMKPAMVIKEESDLCETQVQKCDENKESPTADESSLETNKQTNSKLKLTENSDDFLPSCQSIPKKSHKDKSIWKIENHLKSKDYQSEVARSKIHNPKTQIYGGHDDCLSRSPVEATVTVSSSSNRFEKSRKNSEMQNTAEDSLWQNNQLIFKSTFSSEPFSDEETIDEFSNFEGGNGTSEVTKKGIEDFVLYDFDVEKNYDESICTCGCQSPDFIKIFKSQEPLYHRKSTSPNTLESKQSFKYDLDPFIKSESNPCLKSEDFDIKAEQSSTLKNLGSRANETAPFGGSDLKYLTIGSDGTLYLAKPTSVEDKSSPFQNSGSSVHYSETETLYKNDLKHLTINDGEFSLKKPTSKITASLTSPLQNSENSQNCRDNKSLCKEDLKHLTISNGMFVLEKPKVEKTSTSSNKNSENCEGNTMICKEDLKHLCISNGTFVLEIPKFKS